MEQPIIAYFYENTKGNFIGTKRLNVIPQYGDVVILKDIEFKIIQANLDYEVSKSGVFLYEVIVEEN